MPQPFLNPKTPHVVQKLYYLQNFFNDTKTIHKSEHHCSICVKTPHRNKQNIDLRKFLNGGGFAASASNRA